MSESAAARDAANSFELNREVTDCACGFQSGADIETSVNPKHPDLAPFLDLG
jgi:hypothetical protein